MNLRNTQLQNTGTTEQESFLNRIILHLHRTHRFSINSPNLAEKSTIPIDQFPSTFIDSSTHAFTNRFKHPGEIEGDYSNRSCQFHYFHLYLNLTYMLLIAPFRPVRQNGHFILSRNKFQKNLCLISCMLIAFRQFTIIRATWGRKFHHPTIFYFYLAHVHLHAVLTSVFYWIFYAKVKNLESLLEQIGHSYLLSPSTSGRNKVWPIVIFLHILFPLMGFLSPAVGHNVIDSWSWTPSWLFRSYVSKARYAFFLCTDVSQIAIRPEWSEITDLDIMFTSFYILIIAINELQMYLMSLMFGICAITLWTAANEFKKSIQSLRAVNLNQSLRINRKQMQTTVTYLYNDLKDVSNSINQVWGFFCIFYIIDIIPYLATDLDFGLRSMDWFDALKMFRSVVFFGLNMIMAAETYRKAQWFMSWLLDRENRELFANNMQELTLLLDELRTEPIGIGTSGFYQVNYALGAQVCTIIITFFIITLQYADLHPNATSWWA